MKTIKWSALLTAIVLASPLGATELDYRFEIHGCGNDPNVPFCGGSIGGTPFGFFASETMTFDYIADTSDIVPWTAQIIRGSELLITHGEELLGGTARFTLTDASGTVLQQGAFASSNHMFVSVDNGNSAIGLGNAGVLPGAPGFPGDVAYPFGFFSLSGMSTYDLSTALGPVSGTGQICGFFNPAIPSCSASGATLILSDGRPFSLYSVFYPQTQNGTFLVTAVTGVPEPATLGLLGLGLAGVLLVRRERRV